jgi:ATP-dependent Clp protease adaptor protein ClpS
MELDRPTPIKDFDQDTQILPPWHVVLLDDNDHTYDYVIEMLQHIFGYNRAKAYQMAVEVDTAGRVVVWTGPLEHAELKRDQIHSYGADYRIEWSEGSMSAILEAANE